MCSMAFDLLGLLQTSLQSSVIGLVKLWIPSSMHQTSQRLLIRYGIRDCFTSFPDGISGRIFSIIKSFLTGRSMRVVVNGQSSKVFGINAGVPQGSVLGPTLFLLFINDLPDSVIRSFINIFADDTTIYGLTSKNLNHSDLASNLSSDLSVTVQWGNKWLVKFNPSKTKLITFHHHQDTPVNPPITMDGAFLEESPPWTSY